MEGLPKQLEQLMVVGQAIGLGGPVQRLEHPNVSRGVKFNTLVTTLAEAYTLWGCLAIGLCVQD